MRDFMKLFYRGKRFSVMLVEEIVGNAETLCFRTSPRLMVNRAFLW